MTPKVFGRAISSPVKSIGTEQPARMEFWAKTINSAMQSNDVGAPVKTGAFSFDGGSRCVQ